MLVSTNPATDEIVWEGRPTEELDSAFGRAANSKWPEIPIDERIEILLRFSPNKEELAYAISNEMGKPLWEAKSEVEALLGKVAISIEAYDERCAEKIRGHVVTRHRPHGICAVLGPFNFPAHLPNGHIVPALLAGNTVIFKPSEFTPLVGELLVGYWEEAGLPEGTLTLVQGDGAVGKALAEHPRLNACFFTGSADVGLQLSRHFGNHPDKLLALEMGGNCPLVVSQVANVEAAAIETIHSAFITSGQRCSCARRLIVIDNDPFIDALKAKMEEITVGPPLENPFMGPLVSTHAASRVRKQANLAGEGPYIAPTLLEERLPDEEIFGPVLQLIRVPNLDAAIEEANNTRFGLTAALFSDDEREWHTFSSRVRAGVINWNRRTTGASSAAPFGGIGLSGNHRPSAFYAADYCSYPVASMEGELTTTGLLP